MSEWRNGIQKAWNNRFTATNGSERWDVVFVPMFVNEAADLPDCTVMVDESPAYVRADVSDWWANNSGDTVAHEFGHTLGNSDEYGLPAHASDMPATLVPDPGERGRSGQEGLPAGSKTQPSAAGWEGGRRVDGKSHRQQSRRAAPWLKVLGELNFGDAAPRRAAVPLRGPLSVLASPATPFVYGRQGGSPPSSFELLTISARGEARYVAANPWLSCRPPSWRRYPA